MNSLSRIKKHNKSKEVVRIKTLPLIQFNKAVYMCKELANRKNIFAFWKIDDDNPEINIYTKKEDENEANYIINQFESEYELIIRKRDRIVNHRHKNNNT